MEYRVYKSKKEAELDRKKVKEQLGESAYKRAKRAKAQIHEANRLGWPDTEDAIRSLVESMDPDEQTVCYCGRFIHRWNGWHFKFPSTVDVIGAMESGEGDYKLKFVEDEEG